MCRAPPKLVTVKHAVDGPYAAALGSDAYRLSCGTFAVFTVLSLLYRRDEMSTEALIHACIGPLQSYASYMGDVHLLGRGHNYWPDLILAPLVSLWAMKLYGALPAFRRSAGFSVSCFALALYRNHKCRKDDWVLLHVLWHCLPLTLYAGLFIDGPDVMIAKGLAVALLVLHLTSSNRLGPKLRPKLRRP